MDKLSLTSRNDDFIASHTLKITSNTSIFDGHSDCLNPPVRHFLEEATIEKHHRGFRKNIHTDGFAVSQVVEMISIALTDARGESYGGSKLSGSNMDGNHDKNGYRHRYELYNVQFHPDKCTWDAFVKFSVPVVENKIIICSGTVATTNDVPKGRALLLQGTFPLHVACSLMVDIPNQDSNNQTSEKGSDASLSSQHYIIDTSMGLTQDSLKSMDKVVLSAISETLDRITYDISRVFIMEKILPLFQDNHKGRHFSSIYQLNTKLKSGSFSTVYAATHRSSGEKCAVKCTNRKKLCPQDDVGVLSEAFLLSSLDHAGICTVQDFFMEDDGCYYIVMPLMEGGDVFDSIGRMKSYDENIARNLVRNLLKAMSYLHGNNIVHCDLKSKNLLLRRTGDPSSVVLGDFGFATRVYFPKSLTRQCGTPYFVAPEVLRGTGYDTQADMWSLGVIVYSLLSGDLPFTGRTHLELFKKILGKQPVDFEADVWGDVSDTAKDLIRKMLVTDPCSRLSAMDALQHEWIQTDSRILSRNSLMNTSARLKTFNARLRLKSAMLAIRSVITWRNIALNNRKST